MPRLRDLRKRDRLAFFFAQQGLERRRELGVRDIAVGTHRHGLTIGDSAEAYDIGATRASSDVGHPVADHGNCAVALGDFPAHDGLAVGARERRALVKSLIGAIRVEL